ncbi:hypothetical protein [Superficieibacter sp. 1612_C1]|uniref:hypothetical protein n=1 Tax=Superficieibacter sp. 1612_C1 TaxID=2780382 RepID=UPI001883A695|nr:hypothetical protein [Superficieibacter sp. 1612_C1]
MRITVLDDDPGKKINPAVERYKVFLNGEEVKHCFTVDDEKGEIVESMTDESGRVISENSEVKRRTRYGKVTIERIP